MPENLNKLEELRKKYQKPSEILEKPQVLREAVSQDLSQNPAKNRLNELKQKYQKSEEKPEVFNVLVTKPQVAPVNRLEELKRKYQKPEALAGGVANRPSETLRMGKSVSTTHVSCENKTVKKRISLNFCDFFFFLKSSNFPQMWKNPKKRRKPPQSSKTKTISSRNSRPCKPGLIKRSIR